MDNYIVFFHENTINGKKYFGITSQEPGRRWRNGNGYRNNEYFYRAITKYGWETFSHNIICEGVTKEEAESKEIELIAVYDTSNPRFGYNIENGGNGTGRAAESTRRKISEALKGHSCSEETRNKISSSKKGKQSPNKGKKMPADVVEKNRISHLGQTPWNKGRKWDEEEKAKFNGKAVLCVETGTIYPTAHKAGRDLNIDFSSICKCCRGVVKTAGGYHWEYFVTAQEWSLTS